MRRTSLDRSVDLKAERAVFNKNRRGSFGKKRSEEGTDLLGKLSR